MAIVGEYIAVGGVKLSGSPVTQLNPRIYYNLSGGLKLSGTSSYFKKKYYIGSGGNKLTGIGTPIWYKEFTYTPSGGIKFAGVPTLLKKKIPVPLGGIKTSGIVLKQKSVVHIVSGGIKLSGSLVVFHKKKFVSSGGVTTSGTYEGVKKRSYIGSSGLNLSGTYEGVKKRSYIGSGGFVPQGGSLSFANFGQFIIDTVCIIGPYQIFWQHARELTVSVNTEETTDLRTISINGRGMTPPPFSVTSFTTPVPIYFRKQGFDDISGVFYLTNVSLDTEENEAWWDWTVQGVEVASTSLSVGSNILTWDQAREINVTYSIDESDTKNISVSGRGIVPPPFSITDFSQPVVISYTKDGTTLTGTFEISDVSINGEGIDLWWSWELSGTEVPSNPNLRAYITIDGVTLTDDEAKELNASISTEQTTVPRTLSASGRGTVPPPFTVNSYTTPVVITYSKGGSGFTGTFYISSISIQGEEEDTWWAWSIEGYEIIPTVVSVGGISPTWDQAREINASIEIDILGLKVVSISGRGIQPFSVGPFSAPVTITYTKGGSGFTGSFFVTGTSLEGEEDGVWWSWSLEATELITASCTIDGTSPTWAQARELTASYTVNEDGVKSISISGRGTAPFYPPVATDPVVISYIKNGYGFSGTFAITSSSVDSEEDLWWAWSIEGEEKDSATNRAYITIDTLFSYDEAREINASIEELKAIYPIRSGNGALILRAAWTGKHTISISGRGIVPPPTLGKNFTAPVFVEYTKGGVGFNGTYYISESSVDGEDDGKWWSWSVSGEEV